MKIIVALFLFVGTIAVSCPNNCSKGCNIYNCKGNSILCPTWTDSRGTSRESSDCASERGIVTCEYKCDW